MSDTQHNYKAGDIFTLRMPLETMAFSYSRNYPYDKAERMSRIVRMNFPGPFVYLFLLEIFNDGSIFQNRKDSVARFCFLCENYKIYIDHAQVEMLIPCKIITLLQND